MKKTPTKAMAPDNQQPHDTMRAAAIAAYRVFAASAPSDYGTEEQACKIIGQLVQHTKSVRSGDLSGAEAMLVAQAEALQALFARLTERGMAQSSMDNLTAFLRLSLKAQSQCRATLETLATIKNPPIFAKQVNQTSGPQQVNTQFNSGSRAEKKQNEQNQLSTDARTTCPPVRGDSPMEALGAVNRTPDGGR